MDISNINTSDITTVITSVIAVASVFAKILPAKSNNKVVSFLISFSHFFALNKNVK